MAVQVVVGGKKQRWMTAGIKRERETQRRPETRRQVEKERALNQEKAMHQETVARVERYVTVLCATTKSGDERMKEWRKRETNLQMMISQREKGE